MNRSALLTLAISSIAVGFMLSACERRQPASTTAPGVEEQAATADSTGAQEHTAVGTIDSIDRSAGAIRISHEAVPSIGWPAMTMNFPVQDREALAQLTDGLSVEFSFTEQSDGQYVVTSIAPRE